MKQSLFTLFVLSAVLLLTAVDCHRDDPVIDPTEITFTYGGYFLSGGNPGENNAEITQLNTMLGVVNQRAYAFFNDGKTLGDQGSDIHILGNKLYIALAGSRQIRVLDKFNCKDLGTITVPSESGSGNLTPCSLASFEDALLVSFAEGYVARIDTTSLRPSLMQQVGDAPLCIAVTNQKLYVANALDGNEPGHTLQMLNPVDLHVMKTVEVAANPASLAVDPASSDLYLICAGSGPEHPACLQHIDSDNETVTTLDEVSNPVMIAAGNNGSLLVYVNDGRDDLGGRFVVFNTENQKVEGEFIRDGSYVRNPCMVAVDTNAGNVYIAEHSDRAFGMVYIYTSFGQFITSFSTNAPRPVDAVFVTGN